MLRVKCEFEHVYLRISLGRGRCHEQRGTAVADLIIENERKQGNLLENKDIQNF